MLDLWSVEAFVAFYFFLFISKLLFHLHVCTWYFPIALDFCLRLFVCNVCVEWHRWNEPKDFPFLSCSFAQNHSTNLNVNFRFAMENVKAERGILIQFHFMPESWSHLGLRVTEVVLIFAKRCTQWSKCMHERERERVNVQTFVVCTVQWMHALVSIRLNLHFICYFPIFPVLSIFRFRSPVSVCASSS